MGIIFTSTKTSIPGVDSNLYRNLPLGYSYRKGARLVSFFGQRTSLFLLNNHFTVSETTEIEIRQWASDIFGASNVVEMSARVGEAVKGVWRPGLYYSNQINEALGVTDAQRRADDQALGLLINKLYDLFVYIEPTENGLASYSHKTRELLILAATEAENMLRKYAQEAGIVGDSGRYKTTDYVRLRDPLYLPEYEVKLKSYPSAPAIMPFANWDSNAPTQSLIWYDAYNKTKHNREDHFGEASLARCIEAVSACVVLFSVRYSPLSLYEGRAITSSYFNQLFDIRLVNPDPRSFYIPDIDVSMRPEQLVCGWGEVTPWVTIPLTI